MPAEKPVAFSYVRLSTDAQRHGDGLRRQLEASSAYALENGLQMASGALYEDLGVSAFKGANVKDGALGRFVAAAEKKEIPKNSFLLVESLDRISREEITTALPLFLTIINAGVTLVTLTDRCVYQKGKIDTGQLMYSIMVMGRAHDESRTKSKRLSAAWSTKRAKAGTVRVTSRAPAWLKASATQKFEVLKDRVKVVRGIFEAAAKGQGSYLIARRLNEKGVPKFTTLGAPGWQKSYVSKILTNRSVLGEFQPHRMSDGIRLPEGPVVRDYFPRIIEDDLFLRAQAGRSDRRIKGAGRKGRGVTNIFSGLMQCGHCKGPMHFINKGRDEKYFVCDRARRGLECRPKAWRYGDFELSFFKFVSEVDLSQFYSESDHSKSRKRLEDAILAGRGGIATVTKQRDDTFALLGKGPSAHFIRKKLDTIEAELSKHQEALKALEDELHVLNVRASHLKKDGSALAQFIKRMQSPRTAEVEDIRTSIAGYVRNLVQRIELSPLDSEPPSKEAWDNFHANEKRIGKKAAAAWKDNLLNGPRYMSFTVQFRTGAVRGICHPTGDPETLLQTTVIDLARATRSADF